MHRSTLAAAAVAVALAWPLAAKLEGQLLGCTISTTPVPFGSYDVFAPASTDSTGSVSYSCFLAVSASIRIDLSQGGASSFSPRQLASGAERLDYNLFLDAARSTIWGDGTGGTSFFQTSIFPLVSTSATVTVYGRIPSLQNAHIGDYADTIVATITF